MPLDFIIFQRQFLRFEARILHNSGTPFVSILDVEASRIWN
jgi:hypothetical protein